MVSYQIEIYWCRWQCAVHFTEFLSYRSQGVVVDGAASEWIPIISGMIQGSMLGSLQFILDTSKMFQLVENRLFAYADDSTILAVVRKPAVRPAVAAFLNRDMARIQEWCNHWSMILNPNKTKALVASRSRTVSLPHGDLVLSVVSIRASPNLDILHVKFDSKLTFEENVRGIVFRVFPVYCFPSFPCIVSRNNTVSGIVFRVRGIVSRELVFLGW